MARRKTVISRRRMRRRCIQPSNGYAFYIAQQESKEIKNALYTLQQFEIKKQTSNVEKVRVPVSIIAAKQ